MSLIRVSITVLCLLTVYIVDGKDHVKSFNRPVTQHSVKRPVFAHVLIRQMFSFYGSHISELRLEEMLFIPNYRCNDRLLMSKRANITMFIQMRKVVLTVQAIISVKDVSGTSIYNILGTVAHGVCKGALISISSMNLALKGRCDAGYGVTYKHSIGGYFQMVGHRQECNALVNVSVDVWLRPGIRY